MKFNKLYKVIQDKKEFSNLISEAGMMEQTSGILEKEINLPIGEKLYTYKSAMFMPGLIIKKMSLEVDIDKSSLEDYDLYITSPDLKTIKYTSNRDFDQFIDKGVNGMWQLNFVSKIGMGSGILKKWRLNFLKNKKTTPVSDYGIVSTVIGDGSKIEDKKSKSGQNSLGPMGGRSWGVCLDSKGVLYYNSLDQGFIARLNSDNTITHIFEGLKMPVVMDFDHNDDLYIAENGRDRVIKLLRENYYKSFEIILDSKEISKPTAVRFGRNGKLYISDSHHHRIIEYDLEKKDWRTVAGTGDKGFEGDDGPSHLAKLNYPIDIEVTRSGVLIIADGMNNRLRAVNLTNSYQITTNVPIKPGEIKTICGKGEPNLEADSWMKASPQNAGFSGDGSQAINAKIDWPFCPREDSKGRVWFFDADNHRLRVIESSGLIFTLGGNAKLPDENGLRYVGSEGLDLGDGKSSLNADFNRAMDMELIENLDNTYDLYIGDTDNNKVRKIEGIKFIRTGIVDKNKYVKFEITELKNGKIFDNKLLGFESHFKNIGNSSGPSELVGNLEVAHILKNLNNETIKISTKGPVYPSSRTDIYDKSFGYDPENYDGPEWDEAKDFSKIIPGAIDVYGPKTNAHLDISGVSDGDYYYGMIVDPLNNYHYRLNDDLCYGKWIRISLYTNKKGEREVKRIGD